MAVTSIKQNDTAPMTSTLKAKSGLDLSTAQGVVFAMKQAEGPKIVTRTCEVLDSVKNIVKWTWATGDTSKPGLYNCEFQVTNEDGTTQTYPSDGYEQIEIVPEIAT